MFLTLCYALLTLFLERQRNRVSRLLKDNILQKGSIVFHHVESPIRTPSSVLSTLCYSSFSDKSSNILQKSLLEEGTKAATFLVPKQKVDLHSWAIPESLQVDGSSPNYVTILVEAVYSEPRPLDLTKFSEEALQLEDYCIPKAWKTDNVFGLVGQSSVADLSVICTAFLNNKLLLTKNMEVKKIMTVDVEEYNQARERAHSEMSSAISSSWYYSSSEHAAETLAQHSVLATNDEDLCLGPNEWRNEGNAEGLVEPVEFPMLDFLDKEYYGGSNESLAEKVAIEYSLPLEESDETDSDYEEGLSIISNTSNEACAGSQSNSPLKCSLPPRPSCLPLRATDTAFQSLLDGYCDEAGETMAATPDSPYVPSYDTTPSSGIHSDGTFLHNKPPNILIYTGENDGFCPYFNSIKKHVQSLVDKHSYVIYLLPEMQILKKIWKDNTSLLIVACGSLSSNASREILQFFSEGGRVLVHCTELAIPSKHIVAEPSLSQESGVNICYKSEMLTTSLGKIAFKCTKHAPDVRPLALALDTKEPVITEVIAEETGGTAILSQVCLFGNDDKAKPSLMNILRDILSHHLNLSCAFLPELHPTPAFLFSGNQSILSKFMATQERRHSGGKVVHRNTTFYLTDDLDSVPPASSQHLPILLYPSGFHRHEFAFDYHRYFSNLQTSRLGKLLVFSEVLPTTMTVVEGLAYNGLVAVSHYQTEGKGRGKNMWLSPKGCAMFSLHMQVSVSSNLGQHVSFLQHLNMLAVIKGICDKPGYENLNLKIKWPNDIYYGRDVKLGGCIINSVLSGNEIQVNIGTGLNVSNSKPTMCVNDLIHLHNASTGSTLEEFTVEEVIARALSCLEKLVDEFQLRGVDAILPLYYKHWLHSNQEVTLGDSEEMATIVGLDDYGFLRVRTSSGDVVTVQPDGNSFDMTKNLIVPKTT